MLRIQSTDYLSTDTNETKSAVWYRYLWQIAETRCVNETELDSFKTANMSQT